MQISASGNIEKSICHLISANIEHKVSRPIFQGQRSSIEHSLINYVCLWHAMQILNWQRYRKCDFLAVSQPI